MPTAKVFMTGRSQAIRLPKEFRFKDGEVQIARLGDFVVLFPVKKGWDLLEQAIGEFTPDFMADRWRSRRSKRRRRS